MEEVEYLRQGGLLVTSTRIEIAGQTFAVRNVGSVKVNKPGVPWLAAVVIVVAVIASIGGAGWGGWLVALAAAAWMYQQMRTRSLVLITGGGEVLALKSTNGQQVEALRSAVAQAIAVR